MANASDQPVAYEPSDAEPRLIAWLGVGIALFLVLSPLILAIAFPGSLHRLATGPYPPTPEPRLQISPRVDLASFRSEEEKRLSGYGWADAKQKIIHMPIGRAKELIIERGLPGWSRLMNEETGLEHDPEKWEPVFGKRSCSNKELERDSDWEKNHPAPVGDRAIRIGRDLGPF